MSNIDTADIVVLILLLAGSIAYLTKGKLWAVKKSKTFKGYDKNAVDSNAEPQSTDIIATMEKTGKNMVIFYGSQTGTAEDYATRLAKEAGSRYGLKAMTADLENYEFENLDVFPQDKVMAFVMATYGEGEPTDNAVQFCELVTSEEPAFSEGASAEDEPLKNIKYVAFGLGNNTYEQYNEAIKSVDNALTRLGAQRIGKVGLGDDGSGTMEEDFLAWKDDMWATLASQLGLTERESVYEPSLKVVEVDEKSHNDDDVFVGEHSKEHLSKEGPKGPYGSTHPYLASVLSANELFTVKGRNCIQVELDLGESNLKYKTGDHAAIWPMNADQEVDALLKVLGLEDRRDKVIDIKKIDPTAKISFPVPTTYDTVVRHHLEINGPVSRQFLSTVLPFAPTAEAKKAIQRLSEDKDLFAEEVTALHFNIASVLSLASGGEPWKNIPFSLIIEFIPHLQPRYYSISSSSLVEGRKPHITAVVESIRLPGQDKVFKGVATNYILGLSHLLRGSTDADPSAVTYRYDGPRSKLKGGKMAIHIRRSNFKLPSDPSKPIIMVGPGTGVAPFRGFVRERAKQAATNVPVGKSVLFYGCRHPDQDFLFKDEWPTYKKELGSRFELKTAFSRLGKDKVYVQHILQDDAKEVNELLEQGAYIYVCGDASGMARDVSHTFAKIIADQRGLSQQQGEELVKLLRVQNLYQEDVW